MSLYYLDNVTFYLFFYFYSFPVSIEKQLQTETGHKQKEPPLLEIFIIRLGCSAGI